MSDDYDDYDDYDSVDEEATFNDYQIEAVLAAYRSQQLRQHLAGPLISFVVHVVALVLLCLLVVPQQRTVVHAVEVTIEEVPVKEIEEKVIEEIEEVEEEVVEEAPQMETPDVPTEAVSDSAIEDASDEAPESDDDMEMEEVLDVMPHATPLKMAGLYGGRTASGRAAASRKYGASSAGQNAVLKGLRWLASVQRDNGSWENVPAHTGLALLCFLAHGETPLSEEFGLTVQKAMQWLASGMPTGKPWKTGDQHGSYAHGIATYALAEAYGMTQIPFLKSSMEAGLDTIVRGQQPGGGFDYHYAKGARWDLSVAGWNYQALKAGLVAGSANEGVPRAIEKGIAFTKRSYRNGKFGYHKPGADGSGNITGIGTLCLQLLGEKRSKEAQSGVETLMDQRLKMWDKVAANWEQYLTTQYGFYYDTQAVFHHQGRDWNKWNRTFQKILTDNQHQAGYWTTKEAWHGLGGPSIGGKVLTTCFTLLQLEVYYRYLPTFKMPKENIVQAGGGIGGGDTDAGLIIDETR